MASVSGPALAATVAIFAAGAPAAGARDALAAARAAPARPPALTAAQMSMGQAVRLVEQRYRARVVRAETRRLGDRTIYVLRLLDDAGRVFTVRVDAASGRII